MREPSPMAGEKKLGIVMARILIPALPPGYLSRKHLFPLIDNDSSGTTFVIAPAGFGKTSLVADWAQNQERGVIWMTVTSGDSLNEMSAMLIAATRQVIPNFGNWFEKEQPIRPTEVVRRWGNELMQSEKEFIYVLDVLRSENSVDVDIAVKIIQQFPSNVHFVVIRKDEIEGIYPICASRGSVKAITVKELRFSDEEVQRYAINTGLDLTPEVLRVLESAHGWPSAVSLLCAHLKRNGEVFDVEELMTSQVEPLRALAMMVIQNLDPVVINICEKLSIFEVFSLEIAEFILGEEFSFDIIHAIAQRGEIFTLSRDPQGGFVFSPMVRQVFLEKLRKRSEVKRELHQKLVEYFESIGQPSEAIQHAFELGDAGKISQLFPVAARIKQAQGRGGELLRWSVKAGDNSIEGQLKRMTVAVTGYLADLDFQSVKSECLKIEMLCCGTEGEEFYRQFVAGALAYIYATLGNYQLLEDTVKRAKVGSGESYLGVDDQINLLRLIAVHRYMRSDATGVQEILNISQELGKKTTLFTSHTFILSIHAMHLHQCGEYRRAHEIASMALSQYQRHELVGNHGPLDVMYVIARTLLEFSQLQAAMEILDEIQKKAYQWKQWHWYFTCDKNIFEYLTFNGNQKEVLERVSRAREFVKTLNQTNELEAMIDINEMAVRRNLMDFDRLETLVNRAPDIRDTQIFRMAVDDYRGRKSASEAAKKLPVIHPRDLIWKHLVDVSLNIETEHLALPAMRKAMKVGAEVGARETFLRQRDDMGNLIIKVATEFPTLYNEELASAMAERMRERGSTITTTRQSLTKRELEILRQLSTGRTLTVIAGELHISQNTMKTHLKNLYKKMGAEGRHDAVEKAKSTFLL